MDTLSELSGEVQVSFVPPFEARDKNGIMAELGLSDSPHRRLMEPLAFGVEVGHYPRLEEIVRICASLLDKKALTGDAVLVEAVRRFEQAVRLGLAHEQFYGPGSARSAGHSFWPNVWERDRRIDAARHSVSNNSNDTPTVAFPN